MAWGGLLSIVNKSIGKTVDKLNESQPEGKKIHNPFPQSRYGGIKPPKPEKQPYDNMGPPVAADTKRGMGLIMDEPTQSGTQTSFDSQRGFNIDDVNTQIDQDSITAPDAVKSDVALIDPPEDIDAAQIGEYTPYTEVLGEVDPGSTVEGRLTGLLSQNNPYIDRARTRADQMSNRRGMLNSSMAAGAAEGAAIDRALPIAQQDAAAFLEQQFINQGYSNEAARHLADASIERENLQAGLEQQTRETNQSLAYDAAVRDQDALNQSNRDFAAARNEQYFARLSADLQGQLKRIDNDLAMRLTELESEYSLLQNLDTQRGNIYQQMIAEFGTILANEEDASVANAKINALIDKAGVEMKFSDGVVSGSGKGGGPKSGDLKRPPKPAGDYKWDNKKWMWVKKKPPPVRNDRGGGRNNSGTRDGGGRGSAFTGNYNFSGIGRNTRSGDGGEGRGGSSAPGRGGTGGPPGGTGTGGAPGSSAAGGI